jgi:hypothetical protein
MATEIKINRALVANHGVKIRGVYLLTGTDAPETEFPTQTIPEGSLYLRSNGTSYRKIGAGNTAGDWDSFNDVEQLNDLSDVTIAAPADKHVLVYDGVTDNKYENRLLTEADISDLQSYLLDTTDTFTGVLTVTGSAAIDNITIDGNSITSTDTNGNITLTPNGTGVVSSSSDVVLDAGMQVLAGSGGVSAPSLSFNGHANAGFYTNGTNTMYAAVNGSIKMDWASSYIEAREPIFGQQGTAAAPGYAFTPNESDTGMFMPAANEVGLSAGGVERLKASAAGIDIGNINVNGNTISSTDVNGNINLTPNGTGLAQVNGNRILTVLDEGTGGGLDADTVDGLDSLQFVRSDANDSLVGDYDITGLLDVDNVRINGNDISSTDINGNITMTPNGTGIVSVASDLTVTGDLTVSGTTTTVNSNEVNIADAIIKLNSDETGTATQNAGLEIERGTDANVTFLWEETANQWQLTDLAGTFEVLSTNNVISDLSDVNTTGAADGHILTFNNTSGDWESAAAAQSGMNLEDSAVAVTGGPHTTMNFTNSGGAEMLTVVDATGGEATIDFDSSTFGGFGDVDLTTTAPVADDVLTFDGTNWVPLANTGGEQTDTNAVTTIATLDSELVDGTIGVIWDVVAIEAATNNVQSMQIRAIHNGITGDATVVDYTSFADLIVGTAIAGLDVTVDLDGATTAQVMRLRAVATPSTNFRVTKKIITL